MRPTSPLFERLSTLLDLQIGVIEHAVNTWPPQEPLVEPCWPGPRISWHAGRNTPTPRAIFTEMLGPLHTTWRLRRVCKTRHCCQPAHYVIDLINRSDGTPVEPLPVRTFVTEDLTLDDVIDLILMGEERDPDTLAAKFDVPVSLVHEALAIIERDGL